MEHYGSAEWKGGIRDGSGTLSTESLVLKDTPYSFKTRFEDAKGTNPEELIGAAHAGCFSMAFSLILERAGLKADNIETKATVSLEKEGEGFAITKVHLEVQARIPNIDQAQFEKFAGMAKEGCPVSKLMKANITMNARLV